MPRRGKNSKNTRGRALPKSDQMHDLKMLNLEACLKAFKMAAFHQRFCQGPECEKPRAAWNAHHVVTEREIRKYTDDPAVVWDPRNALRLCTVPPSNCHGNHHNAGRRVPLTALLDENYEFAVELLGPGYAYEYLKRNYAGKDPRLEEILLD